MMTEIFRPRTSRWRAGRTFEERRTNAWSAFIGFLLGRGLSSEAIAARLDDGTTSDTVRRMARLWELPAWGRKNDGFFVIPATVKMRANLQARADQRALSLEEYCRRILICASTPTDLYDAIVPDDQFEDVT
jgi:hypothetical protein